MKEIEGETARGMARKGIRQRRRKRIRAGNHMRLRFMVLPNPTRPFCCDCLRQRYLKCHYLAAFTAALLNNQPMGFYQPFTLVKDAQRHGLKVRPVDVTRSDWLCTIEEGGDEETRRRGDAATRECGEELKTKQSQRDEMFIDESVCDSFGAHLWAKENSRLRVTVNFGVDSINISRPRRLRDFKMKGN